MNLEESCKLLGAVICEFPPDEDECETCANSNRQLYYIRTDYMENEGEYHCAECIINKAQEQIDWAESFQLNN